MSIIRIAMAYKPKGKPIGYKLVNARSPRAALNAPKSRYVGRGVYVVGATTTRLKGTVESRYNLPRSKRFGKGYQ
jgi:hypothetical protein